MVVPQINLESLSAVGGKPKDFFLLEYFRLYEKHWDMVVAHPEDTAVIDASTGLLLGTCPHKPTREKLWKEYIAERDRPAQDGRQKGNALNATILLCGDLFTYLNTTMEFTEEAYAGT